MCPRGLTASFFFFALFSVLYFFFVCFVDLVRTKPNNKRVGAESPFTHRHYFFLFFSIVLQTVINRVQAMLYVQSFSSN